MRFTSTSTLALVALASCASADEAWTTVFEDVVVTDIMTKTVWVSELPASTQSTSAVSIAELAKSPSAYSVPAIATYSSSKYAFQPSTFITAVSAPAVSTSTVSTSTSSTSETSTSAAYSSSSSVVSSSTIAPVASSTVSSSTIAPVASSTVSSSTIAQVASSAISSSTVAPVASTTSSAPAAYSSSSSSSGTTISVTPHDEYSSSIGVLGCKINTNRVAYWPMAPDCNNLCVKVSYQGRSLNLLRVDQSGGAHDISYDAWNTLYAGSGAAQDPQMGGGIDMTYEDLPMSECADLMQNSDGKLAFEAANSMNFIASCISEPSSWVAQNYGLWNIANAVCSLGYDEECTLDLATSNQPSCPHQLGLQDPLTTCPVYNLAYGTGSSVLAQ